MRDQSDSEKLIPLFNTKPEKHKQQPAFSMPIFCGDKKWSLPIPTDLAYIAVPNSLVIGPEEWPAGWGILVYSEGANCVRCIRVPSPRVATAEQQRDVILSIAVRRDHYTRYERTREFARERRITRNQDQSMERWSTVIRAVMSIIDGRYDSVEQALLFSGAKKFPENFFPELRELWNLRPKLSADQVQRNTEAGISSDSRG